MKLDAFADTLFAEIPLSGNETDVTLCFGARGSYQRGGYAPWPLFECTWDDGSTRYKVFHNTTNQIKFPLGQINLDTTPYADINVWRDYRIVLRRISTCTVKASVYIDSCLVWTNESDAASFSVRPSLIFFHPATKTSPHVVFSYIVCIRDAAGEIDPDTLTLDELEILSGIQVGVRPTVDESFFRHEPLPDVPQGDTWPGDENPFHIFPDGTRGINPECLSTSKNRAEKIMRTSSESHLRDSLPVPNQCAPIIGTSTTGSSINGTCIVHVHPAKADGVSVFASIAAALASLPESGGIVRVSPGIYVEPLEIAGGHVELVGENPFTTVIMGYRAMTNGIKRNALVRYEGTGTFSARGITFYNRGAEWNASVGYDEKRGAALSVERVENGLFVDCLFLGRQDTLYLKSGTLRFEHCYIEGDVDFICGGATAQFTNCHLRALPSASVYIVAAAPINECGAQMETLENRKGFVFYRCLLTMDKAQKAPLRLARGPWVNGSGLPDGQKYTKPSAVFFAACEFGTEERPILLDTAQPWADMDRPCNKESYGGFGNTLNGQPFDLPGTDNADFFSRL